MAFAIIVGLTSFAASFATAGTVTLTDSYWGGNNTYDPSMGDIIGTNLFDITQATATRVNGGNTLEITIYTNYAGAPGTKAAEGTSYGSLFLNTTSNLRPNGSVWDPSGTAANHYGSDTYNPGEFNYAVTKSGAYQITGTENLNSSQTAYSTLNGKVKLSNVDGNPVSYPNAGNSGYYFRSGQAVSFVPSKSATESYASTMTVIPTDWSTKPTVNSDGVVKTEGELIYQIVDNGAFGNDFALAWAMSCANDVIQGEIGGDPISGVPETSTWAMMLLGFGLVGWRLRIRQDLAIATA